MDFIILYIIAALAAVCIVVSLFDVNRFVIRKYEISSRKCTHDLRILQISDLHDKSYGVYNKRLKDKINKLEPDMIFMTGDIMTADRHRSRNVNADDLVTYLASIYPVYFSMGNHEDKMKNRPDRFGYVYKKAEELYRRSGVRILDNESVLLDEYGIRVSGLNIKRKYYKRRGNDMPAADDIAELVGAADNVNMNILLAHNPLYFDTYAEWGADLVLSGHVHGGIIRVPGLGGMLSPDCTFFPKYDGGRFDINGSAMIVSRGLGTHSLPIRVFDPGELVCIDVHKL